MARMCLNDAGLLTASSTRCPHIPSRSSGGAAAGDVSPGGWRGGEL
ncbi:MAG: hypothetical protein ABC611_06000 [Candidatus Methanosuratincola petrocarbonis]